jgi:hypothetical protein
MVAKNSKSAWSKKLLLGSGAITPANATPIPKKAQGSQQNLRNFLIKKKNERILVIGDGNFSFSASLIDLFEGDASKITATCYDSEEILHRKYSDATQHIEKIKDSGGSIAYGVDGTACVPYFVHHNSLNLCSYMRKAHQFFGRADPI